MGVCTGDRADICTGDRADVCTGDRVDVCRAVYGAVRADDSRGRPPWTPPAHCVLYLPHGRGSGRVCSRAFGEPCIEVRAELL